MADLEQYLHGRSYPGRGILVGRSSDGSRAVTAYFIMGRSVNSRNRVFVTEGEGIRTQAYDPALMKDPSLIIYAPVRVLRGVTLTEEGGCEETLPAGVSAGAAAAGPQTSRGAAFGSTSGASSGAAPGSSYLTVVTNGDQTDTVYDGLAEGLTFEQSLRSRTFEPDRPNYTPRISAVLQTGGGAYRYAISILKSDANDPASTLRYTFDYENPKAGQGRFISTYQDDGSPLPSFAGEPVCCGFDEAFTADVDTFTARIWDALNGDNKVSLFTRFIDIASGEYETRIVNKNR